MSMESTPPEWFEAEQESPFDSKLAKGKYKAVHTSGPIAPTPEPSIVFIYSAVAIAVAVAGWTATELLALFETPWLTIPAGVMIALVLRFGCGPGNPYGRATVAAICYFVALMIVLVLLTRREVHEIYGSSEDVLLLEENLFRRRFRGVDQFVAYVLGWAAAWFTSVRLRS